LQGCGGFHPDFKGSHEYSSNAWQAGIPVGSPWEGDVRSCEGEAGDAVENLGKWRCQKHGMSAEESHR
jgi:hypothetical protein